MTSLAIIHRDKIIEQVAQGAMLKLVAADIGVTPAAISNALHDDPDYRKARENGAAQRLEDKYIEIEEAREQTDVSRAREGFRAAAWFAEREFPHRWGAKSEMRVTGGIQVDHTVKSDAASLLASIKTVAQIPNAQSQPAIIDNTTGEVSSE